MISGAIFFIKTAISYPSPGGEREGPEGVLDHHVRSAGGFCQAAGERVCGDLLPVSVLHLGVYTVCPAF